MTLKEYLQERIEIRYDIFKKNSNDERVDMMAEEIQLFIVNNFDNLEVDFMIESLTHLGDAPNIIYDDNGLFAVSSDGYQQVITGNEKIGGEITVYVTKDMWKESIREALKFYLQK
jgi:hypothetical protein